MNVHIRGSSSRDGAGGLCLYMEFDRMQYAFLLRPVPMLSGIGGGVPARRHAIPFETTVGPYPMGMGRK